MRTTRIISISSIIILISIMAMAGPASGLRITRLSVPKAVENGTAVHLSCFFELEGETLYSVRWYRDYVEFYRFLPSNAPQAAHAVRLKGAYVDASRSNSSHVRLFTTDTDSEGTYGCEVSTESPSYSTVRAEQAMKIYVLPQERIYVHGFTDLLTAGRSDLRVGDLINLTCVSGASKPPPKMAWFVNGDMALPDQVTQYPTQTLVNGLQARKLGLQLRVTADLFRRQVLHVRCSATILITYEFEAIRIISPTDTGQQASGPSVQRTREAPVIAGARSSYRIGDWISLNCSTKAEDVHLKWYINGDDAGPLNTREYVTLSENPESGWTLGLRLRMQKHHVQLPELRLRCVAHYHEIVREYETSVDFRSKSYDQYLRSASSSASSSSTSYFSSSSAFVLASKSRILMMMMPLMMMRTETSWTPSSLPRVGSESLIPCSILLLLHLILQSFFSSS